MIRNLVQLQRELDAAGVIVNGLGTDTEGNIITYDANGSMISLPSNAVSAISAHVDTDDEAAVRSIVVPIAQSAVGVGLLALTPAQQRALLACLLYKVGALDPTGKVLPLATWLR